MCIECKIQKSWSLSSRIGSKIGLSVRTLARWLLRLTSSEIIIVIALLPPRLRSRSSWCLCEIVLQRLESDSELVYIPIRNYLRVCTPERSHNDSSPSGIPSSMNPPRIIPIEKFYPVFYTPQSQAHTYTPLYTHDN